jgi:hypothetical protein
MSKVLVMSIGGGSSMKAPFSLDGENLYSEDLENELVHHFEVEIMGPHDQKFPYYYLVKDIHLNNGEHVWGVIVIKDVFDWYQFENNFDERQFWYTEMSREEYDTYVKFFGSLAEWPIRVFSERREKK